MKRVISLLLTVACLSLCTLVSCKGEDEPEVHVFYYTYSDTYISTVRTALNKRLDAAGIKYQDHDANNSQTTQTEQIQTAITKGAKAIAVNIVTTGSDDAASGIVSLAKNAGIPVIFFNREVSDSVVASYDKCSFIGTNAKEAGYLQGDMIGDYLVNNFSATDLNGDGRISYVMFMGERVTTRLSTVRPTPLRTQTRSLSPQVSPSFPFMILRTPTSIFLTERENGPLRRQTNI